MPRAKRPSANKVRKALKPFHDDFEAKFPRPGNIPASRPWGVAWEFRAGRILLVVHACDPSYLKDDRDWPCGSYTPFNRYGKDWVAEMEMAVEDATGFPCRTTFSGWLLEQIKNVV